MLRVFFTRKDDRDLYYVDVPTWEGVRLAAILVGRKPISVVQREKPE